MFCVLMCSLPFLYERNFGPLPYAEDGVELFRVLESLPVLVQTSDPNNVDKTVLRRAQSEGEREGHWPVMTVVGPAELRLSLDSQSHQPVAYSFEATFHPLRASHIELMKPLMGERCIE